MARVSGPFMSAEASGSIDKTLTASSSKGRAYIKGFSVPSNPSTPEQVAHRAKVAAATLAWQNLLPVWDEYGTLPYWHYKNAFDIIGSWEDPPISGFNLFVRAYLWMLQFGIVLPDWSGPE